MLTQSVSQPVNVEIIWVGSMFAMVRVFSARISHLFIYCCIFKCVYGSHNNYHETHRVDHFKLHICFYFDFVSYIFLSRAIWRYELGVWIAL